MLRKYKDVLTSELVKYSQNSRTHSDGQIDEIVASINEFGFTNPLLVDGKNLIIAGHGRLEAANKMGMDKIPCIIVDDLTETQISALVIADNKIAANAGWDYDILKEELDILRSKDFDIGLTGFSEQELDDLFPAPSMDGLIDEDSVPDMVGVEPVSKPGDVWTLGNHRLMYSDLRK